MAVKLYQLFCECGWKRITNGSDVDDLYELKLSPIPKSIPKYDKLEKKTIESDFKDRIRKFRCPKCGHAVKPKKIDDPQAKINEALEKQNILAQQEAEREAERQRIAELQAKDLEHDRQAEIERKKQRELEAQMKLKKYEKED